MHIPIFVYQFNYIGQSGALQIARASGVWWCKKILHAALVDRHRIPNELFVPRHPSPYRFYLLTAGVEVAFFT
jgi:hypothetical protein